jgi:hypothetical protein
MTFISFQSVNEVEVTLRPTVSRPVRLGVLPLLEQVTRCYIYLSNNYFLYFILVECILLRYVYVYLSNIPAIATENVLLLLLFSLFTTCFGPYGPSSGEIQLHHLHILMKPSILQRIHCFTICLLLSTLRYIQWQISFYLFYFLYRSCRSPSLTRGRFCNLQCYDASSVSRYIATDGLSASSSWCRDFNFFV